MIMVDCCHPAPAIDHDHGNRRQGTRGERHSGGGYPQDGRIGLPIHRRKSGKARTAAAGHAGAVPELIPAGCHELLLQQHGVISRAQALGSGMSQDAIRVRLRNGRWQQLHQGVYATFSGEPSRVALIWSAVLSAGPGAAASHQTAAELYQVGRPAYALHVTVPAGRQVRRSARPVPRTRTSPGWATGLEMPRLIAHRSDRISRARHPVLLPPRTRVEETVIDLTQAAATVDEAFSWLARHAGAG
jgi:hypothetical protein